ncbi:MAG: ABC transporter permease [Acidimicrobiia bacterium]
MSPERDNLQRLREAGTAGAGVVGSAVLLDEAVETGDAFVSEVPIRSHSRVVVRRFLRHRIAVAALALLVLFIGLAVFVNVYSAHEANPIPLTPEILEGSRESPTWDNIFGTDKLGRDMYARTMIGLQKSLQIGLGVALASVLIGVTIGALAGFYRGWIDTLLMRFTDLFLVLPALAVLLILAANPEPSFFGLFDFPPANTVTGMIIVISLLGWMPMARIVRGEFLSLREKEFVEAARAAGASGPRIIVRHLLPNAMGPIVVFGTLEVGLAILTEATLSFLGLGIQLPSISLGNLIADAEGAVGTDLAYLVIFPGLVLFLVVLCVNFIGDGLRDALDPRAVR